MVADRQEFDHPIEVARSSARRRVELIEFAQRLTISIEALGYNKASFARSIGVDRGRLHHWTSAGAFPDTAKLLEMDRTHGLSPDWLLKGRMTSLSADVAERIQRVDVADLKSRLAKPE